MTSRWGRGRRPNRPAGGHSLHGTFYDLLVAGRVFKVFKDVGQRGGDTAPFGQVVALAAPWIRGRRPKGPETKLENFENRGAPSFDNFQRSAPGRRAGGDIVGNFENGGHRLSQRFSKSGLRPLGSGGRNPDAESVPSAKAPIYVRPIAMALTGSLTVERRFL